MTGQNVVPNAHLSVYTIDGVTYWQMIEGGSPSCPAKRQESDARAVWDMWRQRSIGKAWELPEVAPVWDGDLGEWR